MTKQQQAQQYADKLREEAKGYDEIGPSDLIDIVFPNLDSEMQQAVLYNLIGVDDD